MNDYSDIIDLPHHVSKTRKRMSMDARAAQFSPFAALTGYDEEIDEAARLTDDRLNISFDDADEIESRVLEAVLEKVIENSTILDVPEDVLEEACEDYKESYIHL